MRAGRLPSRLCIAALAAAAALLAPANARAQEHLADAVKATFLVRFGAFTDWPAHAFASSDAPFVICISGPSGLAGLVERAAAGERIANRPVSVRRVGAVSPNMGCHVVFLGGVTGQSVEAGLDALRGAPVLTVTDEAYGPARGVIHFVLIDRRVRFQIDRSGAERSHLRLSARLLAIAAPARRASLQR